MYKVVLPALQYSFHWDLVLKKQIDNTETYVMNNDSVY